MRAARKSITVNWRLFMAVYAGSLLLAWAFRWEGLCAAFEIDVLQLCHAPTLLLHRIERWYFDENVRGLIKPADPDDAGRGA